MIFIDRRVLFEFIFRKPESVTHSAGIRFGSGQVWPSGGISEASAA
jgi:hypothetical protein